MSHPIDHHFLGSIISGRSADLVLESLSPGGWESVVRLGQEEGLGPLLYWRLCRSGPDDLLPDALHDRLRAMYFGARMNNEQIVRELERLAGSFDQAGISVVALKGVCFALTIYPDIGLRPMLDLDLLVPPLGSSEALRIARAGGYVDAVAEASPGLNELLSHAVCLKKTETPYTTLELHHTLVADLSFTHAVPVDWFWSQTEPLRGSFSGKVIPNLRMLTPTAQLLYACAHAMLQHGGRHTSLRWLYDLDRLICVYAERLDWSLFLSQARSFAWGSAASAALSQVVSLFDTPVPQTVLDVLSKSSDRNTKRVMSMQEPPATHTLEEYDKLKSLNGYGRFKLLIALMVPGPAYMRWRYGLKTSRALPAWYLYRWWVIFKDAVRTALLLIRKAVMQASH